MRNTAGNRIALRKRIEASEKMSPFQKQQALEIVNLVRQDIRKAKHEDDTGQHIQARHRREEASGQFNALWERVR